LVIFSTGIKIQNEREVLSYIIVKKVLS